MLIAEIEAIIIINVAYSGGRQILFDEVVVGLHQKF